MFPVWHNVSPLTPHQIVTTMTISLSTSNLGFFKHCLNVKICKNYSLIIIHLMGSRLWNSTGIRIGQFGQPTLWDIHNPHTWKTREPSYLAQPLIRQLPEGMVSTTRVPIRTSISRGSRVSINLGTPRRSTVSTVSRGSIDGSTSTTETSESSGQESIKMAPISEEGLRRYISWFSNVFCNFFKFSSEDD